LERGLADAGLLDALHVALRRAVVGVAAAAAESAGAAAGGGVLAAAPVERVVDRLEAGPRVGGDLVAGVAAVDEPGAGRPAHLGGGLVVGQRDLAALGGLRHRYFLGQAGERQRVAGDVLGTERHRRRRVTPGELAGLPLDAVDQIERDVGEPRF